MLIQCSHRVKTQNAHLMMTYSDAKSLTVLFGLRKRSSWDADPFVIL